jgi:hypothetical protein
MRYLGVLAVAAALPLAVSPAAPPAAAGPVAAAGPAGATLVTEATGQEVSAAVPGKTKAKVTIGVIPDATARANGTAVIKPVVTTQGNVAIKRTTLTVRGVDGAAGVKRAELPAGTYMVRTTVKYRTYTTSRTKAVVKRVVGVKAQKTVHVKCKAISATKVGVNGAVVSATCTSSKFTGALALTSSCAEVDAGWTCTADPQATFAFLTLPKAGKRFDAYVMPWGDLVLNKVIKPAKVHRHYSATKSVTKLQRLVVSPYQTPVEQTPAEQAPAVGGEAGEAEPGAAAG